MAAGRQGSREAAGPVPDRSPIEGAARLVALLHGVAAGDVNALERLYLHTSAKLYGVCLRILEDRGEAEDVLQEVYLAVWQRAATFDASRAGAVTWLATIARNKAIDRRRAAGGRPRPEPLLLADSVEDPAPLADLGLEEADELRRLEACLEGLEPRQRAAITTAFLEGTTYEELAGRLGVPLGTVKSWIRRGLLRLRACLER